MEFIEIMKAIILGIIEGITEWLPVSSTGHMILVDEFIKLNMTPEFMEMFFVVIQLGAIMAVVCLFWDKLFPFEFKGGFKVKNDTMNLWFKIVVACLPAAVIGLLFDDWLDEHFYNYQTVALMLIIYGILFIIVENYNKGRRSVINDLSQITYKFALMVGVFQLLALIPGTSRSGATIVGAIIFGVSRGLATEFRSNNYWSYFNWGITLCGFRIYFLLSDPRDVGSKFIKNIKVWICFYISRSYHIRNRNVSSILRFNLSD